MHVSKSQFVDSLVRKEASIRENFSFSSSENLEQLYDHPSGIHAVIAFGEMNMCRYLRHMVDSAESISATMLAQDLFLLAESRTEKFDLNPYRGIGQLRGDLASNDAVFAYAESQLCRNLINSIEIGLLLQCES